jgi:hypothetical protein
MPTRNVSRRNVPLPRRTVAEITAKTGLAAVLLIGFLVSGCSKSDPTGTSDSVIDSNAKTPMDAGETDIFSAADLAASGQEPAIGSESFTASKTPLPDGVGRPEDLSGVRTADAVGSTAPVPPDAPVGFRLAEPASGGAIEAIDAGVPSSEPALREDLTAEQLMEVLESSDRDMQTIAGGRSQFKDAKQASEMMLSIAKIKLQAALRIQLHPDATETQRIDGMRGHLQALSHLAAMGDLQSAKALETLARENLKSVEPTIAGDSRIVLIGFAIDALQAGRESAADEIVSLIQGMTENPNSDVPAVLIMARARQILSNYAILDQAAKVREKILELYGGSSNAMIAQVAADAAGTAKFDRARRLLGEILNDDQVALARWTEAVEELAIESPDLNAVQFLASSALQLEAAGRDAFVEETFSILSDRFNDPESAMAIEIRTAKQAMEARRKVIGSPFNFDPLPSVDGKGVSPSDYQDKIILMPFWAISVPESLQLVQTLKQIQSKSPDRIAIIGMNLDPEQAPLREFLAETDLGFPSYRSVSSATASVANPIASRFGLVSMPFVAIFNQQGTVEALDFTGNRLSSVVNRLLDAE